MILADIDLFEVNEAIAVVPVKFIDLRQWITAQRQWRGDGARLSIGATGAMLIGTALDEQTTWAIECADYDVRRRWDKRRVVIEQV